MVPTPIVHVVFADIPPQDMVFVERKGIGHPDTLADHLAELLSRRYCQITLENYGAVLHHNFDKSGILGGKSSVSFGNGKLIAPIRVLINGRVSTTFGGEEVPYEQILAGATYDLFASRFGDLIPKDMISVEMNISNASSPGHAELNEAKGSSRKNWFTPRGLSDLPELTSLFANDTSLGCGYYPLHPLEQFVLSLETELTSGVFADQNKWLGTDIKVMATQIDGEIDITLCIPQIANYVGSIEQYKRNMSIVREYIQHFAQSELGGGNIGLSMNTRDSYDKEELYLTATGSAIESGDEGLVGRGNRINRLISIGRPMSMEGASGKNPVYHVGKVYYVAAHQIAKAIFDEFGVHNEVYLISQSGRALASPWKTVVRLSQRSLTRDVSPEIKRLVASKLSKLAELTQDLIDGRYAIS
jgi:S-adenosylmethionine synthetase